jgi:hypothetical protein
VNLKIGVHRVGLNLRKSGFGAAYRAWIYSLEHGGLHCDTHLHHPVYMMLARFVLVCGGPFAESV